MNLERLKEYSSIGKTYLILVDGSDVPGSSDVFSNILLEGAEEVGFVYIDSLSFSRYTDSVINSIYNFKYIYDFVCVTNWTNQEQLDMVSKFLSDTCYIKRVKLLPTGKKLSTEDKNQSDYINYLGSSYAEFKKRTYEILEDIIMSQVKLYNKEE